MERQLSSLYNRIPYAGKVLLASANGLRLRWWRGEDRARLLQEVRERDGWSISRWSEWRDKRVRYMLDHARATVPYYRELWRTRRGDVHELSDWPVLTKDEIRRNPAAFVSDHYKHSRLLHISSSGTTGTPMRFSFDRRAVSMWYAMVDWRLREWNGIDDGVRWANVGGRLVTPVGHKKPPFWVWNRPMNQLYMSSYHLEPGNIRHYADALRSHRIRYLYGYSSSLCTLAWLAHELGVEFPRMIACFTNAEPLLPHQREIIGRSFQCPVLETYGGSEFAFAACECRSGTLHVWPDAGVMEVLERDSEVACSEGRPGRVVATGLVNESMPLIRYEVGDLAALGDARSVCPCGRNLPPLLSVEGRTDDLIIGENGAVVGRLDPVFKSHARIREAQILQHARDRIEVRVVPAPGYGVEDEADIRQRLAERLGSVVVEFTRVESIPRGPNGKFKAVVSLMKTPPIQSVDSRHGSG